MLKLEIGMPAKGGFTLIEILVVLVIIGITIGFALLAFGDFGSSRRVVTAAESFSNQIKLIQQQAIMESATYGIQVDLKKYDVLKFSSKKTWRKSTNPFFKRVLTFPNNTLVSFTSTSPKQRPSIIIDSSGEMTPFQIMFGTPKNLTLIKLIGEANGDIKLDSELAL
jgi:general secretion pathway protein H